MEDRFIIIVNRLLSWELKLGNTEIIKVLAWKPKLPNNAMSQVRTMIVLRHSNKIMVNNTNHF